jgi:hypothetical protein
MYKPTLAVLGAGLMGVGIACHFARHGTGYACMTPTRRVWRKCPPLPPLFCMSCRRADNLTPPTSRRLWRA